MHRSLQGSLVTLAFLVGFGALGVMLGKGSNPGWLLLNIALFNVMLWTTIIPHEAGHALATKLMGLDVHLIVIGTGKQWLRGTVLGIPIEVRALPLGGLTFSSLRQERWMRLKRTVVLAGGPLVNVVLLWAAIKVGQYAGWHENIQRGFAPVSMFIGANAMVLLVNLWPRSVDTHIGRNQTDGAQLLSLLSKKDEDLVGTPRAAAVQRVYLIERRGDHAAAIAAARSALLEYPDDYDIGIVLSASLLNSHQYAEGRELLHSMSLREPPRPGMEAVVLNNLAWANLQLEDDSLADEARSAAEKAYRLMPWETYIASTHGCAEAFYGDTGKAIELLTSRRVQRNPEKTRASSLSGLAMAYARAGRAEECRNAMAAAERIDAQCRLLAVVRRRLGMVVTEPVTAAVV